MIAATNRCALRASRASAIRARARAPSTLPSRTTSRSGMVDRRGLEVLVHVEPGQIPLVTILAKAYGCPRERPRVWMRQGCSQSSPPPRKACEREKQQHDGAPEVGLLHAKEHEDSGHDEMREKPDGECLHTLGLLCERVSQPDYERDLCHFGRLHVHGPDGRPSGSAPARVPKPGDARHEQRPHESEERVRHLVQAVVVDVTGGPHDRVGNCHPSERFQFPISSPWMATRCSKPREPTDWRVLWPRRAEANMKDAAAGIG